MTLNDKQARLARLLFDVRAVKFGAFRLKAHSQPGNENLPLSPIYLNLRTADHPVNPGPLTTEIMELIGDLFRDLIESSDIYAFGLVADIPDAGKPFGDQVYRVAPTLGLGNGRIGLHKETLPDGSRRITGQVDGEFEPGDTVLLVDDLVTGADTKLEAIAALEGAGLEVCDILAVVDRLQGGVPFLGDKGYDVHTIFTLGDLIEFYVGAELITPEQADEVLEYIDANKLH